VHDTRAHDGSNGLISIRHIGREGFGRARRRLWIAANQAERLVLRREKLDEFVADGAACSKDVDHENLVACIQLSATIRLQIDGIDGESRQLIGDVPDMLKSPLQEMGR